MGWIDGIERARGLLADEEAELQALMRTFRHVRQRNAEIDAYYDGKVQPRPLGPDTMMKQVKIDARMSCDWPRKAVHSLASLVRFNGFVFDDGDGDEALVEVLRDCGFDSAFSRHLVGLLKKGCMFVTVGMEGGRAYVRFHSADSGCAIIDPATERMRSGFVIARTALTQWSRTSPVPVQVNLHMPGRIVTIERPADTASPSEWHATRAALPDGVCMMVPIAYRPTDTRPLGTSRITWDVMDLVDDVLHVRQVLKLTCELYGVPMRYIVGLSAANMEEMKKNPKWALYLNPVFTATRDSKGNVPEIGQLPANSPAALLELLYADAKMFAAATGVPLNSLGIVQDNPSSAEAIAEGRKDLTDEAQALISGQLAPAMREVALLVMMVSGNAGSPQALTDVQRSVRADFRNPAMPSIASSTDAAMKIASVLPDFARTTAFFEMIGFDQAHIRKVVKEMAMAQMRSNTPSLLSETRRQTANGFELPASEPSEVTEVEDSEG